MGRGKTSCPKGTQSTSSVNKVGFQLEAWGMAFGVKDHGTYFQLQSLRQGFAPEVEVQGNCHFFGMEVVYTASSGHRETGWCSAVLSDTQFNIHLPKRWV